MYRSLKIDVLKNKEGSKAQALPMVMKMKNELLLRDAQKLFYGLVEGKYTTKELEEEYNKLVNYHNENYDTNIEEIKIKKGARL